MVWLVSGAYLTLRATRDWIPHDEGALAQSAERVLAGELPHRDFDELYTGGLTFVHAAAFRLLGTRLATLRLTLLAAALVAVPLFYGLAARALTPMGAALATAACVVWSFPNYFAGVPSWYNLILAAAGVAALFRFQDTRKARWAFAAGLCGGGTVLVKVTGAYFVVAAVLSLIHWNQTEPSPRDPTARGRLFAGGVSLALLALPVALVRLVQDGRPPSMAVLHFAAPGSALAVFLIAGEWRRVRRGRSPCGRRLLAALAAFGAGVAAPVAVFLVPYAASGALPALAQGLFSAPRVRVQLAALPLPPPASLLAALPLAALLAVGLLHRGRRVPAGAAAAAAAVAAAAWGTALLGNRPAVYAAVWHSLRPAIPLLALTTVLVLGASRSLPGAGRRSRQQLFAVAASASLVSLVQFPFSAGIYFCYAAPLALLAGVHLCRHFAPLPRRLLQGLGVGYTLFAAAWLNQGSTFDLGFSHVPLRTARLDVERGGLWVDESSAGLYARLVREIQARSAPGDFIYAAPDSPEVYFLSGRRNPTRTLFDFLDEDYRSDPEGRARRILERLDDRGVRVAVLRHRAEFTPSLAPTLVAGLLARYPGRVDLPGFTVLYREARLPTP